MYTCIHVQCMYIHCTCTCIHILYIYMYMYMYMYNVHECCHGYLKQLEAHFQLLELLLLLLHLLLGSRQLSLPPVGQLTVVGLRVQCVWIAVTSGNCNTPCFAPSLLPPSLTLFPPLFFPPSLPPSLTHSPPPFPHFSPCPSLLPSFFPPFLSPSPSPLPAASAPPCVSSAGHRSPSASSPQWTAVGQRASL